MTKKKQDTPEMTEQPQAMPEPVVLGELEENESQILLQMRKAATDIVHQIGNMEVQKARMMGNLSDIEVRSKGIMENISKRLGLAEGVRWQIQDNKIMQVGMTPPQMQIVPEEAAPATVEEKTTEAE